MQAALQPACEAETAYGNLAKNAAGYRGSCATPQGVLVPCDVTGEHAKIASSHAAMQLQCH